MAMHLERLEDLSVIYHVKNVLSIYPSINVVDGYPFTDLKIPVVSVDEGRLMLEDYELGNSQGRRNRRWYIDVFAKTKSQRDEVGYELLNSFKRGITVYDYNTGFPPDYSPASIEHLDVVARELIPIPIDPELVDTLYYRSTVAIVARNDTV